MISDDLDSCQSHLPCHTLSPTTYYSVQYSTVVVVWLQPVPAMIESDQIRAELYWRC